MRRALHGVQRYVATVVTSKHRVFQFLPMHILPDDALIVTAVDDAYFLGVLFSLIHSTWALEAGGTLEDRPRYNKSQCFDPFPFPADVSEALKDRIRVEAEALDALRKRVLAEQADLALTKL